jgi:hypothetical protein
VKLNDLLTALRERRPAAVLVTGPQRSGTTIAAHILAAELGLRYLDEVSFAAHDHRRARELFSEGGVVVQGPGLCHVAHLYGHGEGAVVMMRRDCEAILRSEERIGWRDELDGFNLRIEREKYEAMFGISGKNIALIKYYCWDTIQKATCNAYDLDYESLRQHPLWREPSEREHFGPRQWRSRADAASAEPGAERLKRHG